MIETENSSSIHDEHIINAVEIPSTISIAVKKFNPEILPELKARKIWVLWKYMPQTDGKPKKKPCMPNWTDAKPNDPETWSIFDEVLSAYQHDKNFDGIGFMLNDSGIVVIDYDKNWTEQIDPSLTYTERSPSGKGYHQICNGKKPGTACTAKEIDVEIYEKGHFMTYTEDIVEGSPIDIIETPELI